MSTTSVAESLITAVAEAGYPLLCGLPGGGTSLDLIEGATRSSCRYVPTATESGSVIIAATIGDITGRAPAVTTTLGPGVTSALNGVACASLDRLPLLLVTDDYDSSERARFQRQNVDAARLLAPLTKASIALTDHDPEGAVRHALEIAQQAPRGPVHLSLPASTARRAASPREVGSAAPPGIDAAETGLDETALGLAGDLLERSTRSILLAGAECRTHVAASALTRLAEALAAPVLTTYRGKGSLPDDHPLAAGLFTNGTLERRLLAKTDLIISVGLDPVELLPRDWDLDTPVVDLRETPADRPLMRPAVSVVGPLASSLEALAQVAKLAPLSWTAEAASSRRGMNDLLRQAIADTHRGDGIAPTRVVEIAREAAPPDTIAAMDSGAHMLPVAALWQASEPLAFFCSSGLATMGFAIPSSIGIGIACPSRPVVAFVGDAGFLMSTPELGTLASTDATIVVVVFADSALSLIELKLDNRIVPPQALAMPPVHWEQLAASFGIQAVTVATEPELEDAIAAGIGRDGPSVIVVRVDPSSYARISEVFRGN